MNSASFSDSCFFSPEAVPTSLPIYVQTSPKQKLIIYQRYIIMKHTKKHIIAIILGFIIMLTGAFLSNTYRPYIYRNHLSDFHIADTISSWILVPSTTLIAWGIIRGRNSIKKTLICCVVVLLISEFAFSTTFDIFDLIATVISGSVTYSIYALYMAPRNKRPEK